MDHEWPHRQLTPYGDDIDANKVYYDDMVKELEEYLPILRIILYR